MAIYQAEIMLETMALQVEPDYSKRHVNFLKTVQKIVRKLFIAAVLKVSKTKRKSTAFYTVLFQKDLRVGWRENQTSAEVMSFTLQNSQINFSKVAGRTQKSEVAMSVNWSVRGRKSRAYGEHFEK